MDQITSDLKGIAVYVVVSGVSAAEHLENLRVLHQCLPATKSIHSLRYPLSNLGIIFLKQWICQRFSFS